MRTSDFFALQQATQLKSSTIQPHITLRKRDSDEFARFDSTFIQ
jgi:hypothetical protein